MSYTFQPTGKPFAIQQGPDAEKIDHNFDILFAELRRFNTQVGDNIAVSTLPDPVTVAHGGTGITSYTQGDLLYASSATALSKLADVAAGSYLRSGGVGANPVWSTVTLPNSATTGDILYASASNVYSNLTAAAAGKVLRAAGAATAPAYSSFTIPDTFAQGDVIYGSATNVLSALAKDTNATRYLSNTGTTNNPAWAQVDLTNGVTGVLPPANGGGGSAASNSGYIPIATSRWVAWTKWNASSFNSGGAQTAVNQGWTLGTTTPTGGSEDSVTDTVGVRDRLNTDATAGRIGTWEAHNAAPHTFSDHAPMYEWKIKTGSDVTAIRIWLAFTNAAFTNSDDQHTKKGFGVVYSTVRGDSGWMTWKSDGTTQTVGSQVATIAASTHYTIRVSITGDGGTVTVTINGTSATFTGPTITGVGLRGNFTFINTGSSVRSMELGAIYGERNV